MTVHWPLERLFVVALLAFSCGFGHKSLTDSQDKGRAALACREEPLSLGNELSFCQIEFNMKGQHRFDATRKIWLVMNRLHMIESPEGVYEVYVSLHKPQVNILSSTQPEFVNVLDLYSMSATPDSSSLEIDLSSNLKGMLVNNGTIPTLIITILFRGNTDAWGKTETGKAGQIRFSGVCLMWDN